jgi:hypothetical protein
MTSTKPRRQPITRLTLVVGLLLFGLGASFARAGQASLERGLLFEVRSGQDAPSYLFGTIHSDDARVMDLPLPVRTAFAGADTFVMEVVPDVEAIIHLPIRQPAPRSPGRRRAALAIARPFGLAVLLNVLPCAHLVSIEEQ